MKPSIDAVLAQIVLQELDRIIALGEIPTEHQAGLPRDEAESRALADCGTFWPGRAPPNRPAS
jgi:hypothetical protein